MIPENLKKFKDNLFATLKREEYSDFCAMTESGFQINFDNESNKTLWLDETDNLITVMTSRNHMNQQKHPARIQMCDYDTVKWISICTDRDGLKKFMKSFGVDIDTDEEWKEFLKTSEMFKNHYASNFNVKLDDEGMKIEDPNDLNQIKPRIP